MAKQQRDEKRDAAGIGLRIADLLTEKYAADRQFPGFLLILQEENPDNPYWTNTELLTDVPQMAVTLARRAYDQLSFMSGLQVMPRLYEEADEADESGEEPPNE